MYLCSLLLGQRTSFCAGASGAPVLCRALVLRRRVISAAEKLFAALRNGSALPDVGTELAQTPPSEATSQ